MDEPQTKYSIIWWTVVQWLRWQITCQNKWRQSRQRPPHQQLSEHEDCHLKWSNEWHTVWRPNRAGLHDDVIKWNHFLRYWPFVWGIHRSPSQRPVTRSLDIFLDLRLNKRLSYQSRRRWFETPSRSLWRPCNGSGFITWECFHINILTILKVFKHAFFTNSNSALDFFCKTPKDCTEKRVLYHNNH